MIVVVDYHKGNLKSVERGLIGVGADARITDDASEIARAQAIVLPGVGAFADAIQSMHQLGQDGLLRERVEAGVCHYCPKGHTHSMINDSDEDLVFFAVVPVQ